MHFGRLVAASVAATILSLAPARGAAQGAEDATTAEVQLARELFFEGVQAANDNRWPAALEAFDRAYALVPQPQFLFNLAGALVENGRLLEGVEAYHRFLREAPAELRDRYEEAARTALASAESAIARVRLEVEGASESDQVYFDGELLSRVMLDGSFPADPGVHRIEVRRGEQLVAREELELSSAEQARVTLHVVAQPSSRRIASDARPAASVTQSASQADSPGGSVWSSPWLWIGVAAAVAIAAGVVTWWLLSAQPERHAGNVPPGMLDL